MTQDWTGNQVFLKRVVIILGVLIVIGLGVVIGTIAYRARDLAGRTAPRPPGVAERSGDPVVTDFTVNIPQGAEVEETRIKGTRLVVHIRFGAAARGRRQVLIYDLASGRRLATIDLVPAN